VEIRKQQDNDKKDTINVFFGIEDDYAEPCAVAMTSLLLNSNCKIHFFIINNGLSDISKRRFMMLKKF
jgi:lipopolysaccharide biosynthesis glycosyltransferase